jgi:hypothetical protein
MTVLSNANNKIEDVEDGTVLISSSIVGEIGGFFAGTGPIDKTIALGFLLSDDSTATHRELFGKVLLDGDGTPTPSTLSIPTPATEDLNIDWGTWNNPIEDNWVVVNTTADGAELQTSNHFAMIDPTPVANLSGSGSYGSNAASYFIGSGSAGGVTQVVAGLDVDFNTGIISNGSLQVAVAGSQAWEIDFAGSINNGIVDLNSLGGTLSDPGGLISSSIEANLGGVFTGIGAEAFVGGFDLIDELNQFNQVDGVYTIER